jgi:hypothetical protein
MEQNQNQRQDSNNPGGRQSQGWDSNQNTTIPNQEPTRMENDDINEIPGEHHNKEHQHDYKNPTGEQNKTADENSYPHEWSSEKDQQRDPAKTEQVNPTAGREYRKLEHQYDHKDPSDARGGKTEPHELDRKWYQQNEETEENPQGWEKQKKSSDRPFAGQDDEEKYSDFPDEHQEPDFENGEYKEPARGYDRGEERYQNQGSDREEAGKPQREYAE